jgi:predicted esterase
VNLQAPVAEPSPSTGLLRTQADAGGGLVQKKREISVSLENGFCPRISAPHTAANRLSCSGQERFFILRATRSSVMTTRVRIAMALVAALALLTLDTAGLVRAAEPAPQVITRFLAADGTPLADDWRAAADTPVFVVIHGFQSRGTDEPQVRQAAAIQQRFPQADVVIVDWHLTQPAAAAGPTQTNWLGTLLDRPRRLAADYAAAVAATRQVARDIADWLQHQRIDPARTVLSGHSLGAHIAGFAARDAAARLGRTVHAILAADPAGPSFTGRAFDARLDQTDARHVIVIHTTDSLGCAEPLGTQDVYVAWPDPHTPEPIARHSHARELITESFLRPEMVCDQGHPLAANMLVPASDDDPNRLQQTVYMIAAAQ